MSQENKTVQIDSVVLSMELLAGIYEYINQIPRPFTEKEPYIMGMREAINVAREKKEKEDAEKNNPPKTAVEPLKP